MKITKISEDYIVVDEKNISDSSLLNKEKIHIIKLNFVEPTREKIQTAVLSFPRTNRFVISNNIRLYNDVLKTTSKKYYIENDKGVLLISFLRKNNKILLNFNNLRDFELSFLLEPDIIYDMLRNIEVIIVSSKVYNQFVKIFNGWDGNVIISD